MKPSDSKLIGDILDRGLLRLSQSCLNLATQVKLQCDLSRYQTRSDDIFIVAFPKAGSTVLQMMLYQMSSEGRMDFLHIDTVVPWFDRWIATGRVEALNCRPSPRMFKCHLPLRCVPRNAKCIYIVRNPKDSCVSAYYHLALINGKPLPTRAFVDQFIKGSKVLGSWFDHLKNSFPYLHGRRVLLLRYEDLWQDLAGTVDKVSTFCGFNIQGKKRAEVIERCSIEFMKAFDDKFDPRNAEVAVGSVADWPKRSGFIRQGGIGNWVNVLSPSAAQSIDKELSRILTRLQRKAIQTERRFLQFDNPDLRGTLDLPISSQSGNRLVRQTDDFPLGGAVVANCSEPLERGDRVRLVLKLQTIQIVIAQAEIARLENGNGQGVCFRFLDVDGRDVQLLDETRAALDWIEEPRDQLSSHC